MCLPFCHKYSKWTSEEEKWRGMRRDGRIYDYVVHAQYKTCEKCGKVKRRVVHDGRA